MVKGIQPPGNKAETLTKDGAFILYETTIIRHNNDSYRINIAIYIGWRCNYIIVCVAFWDILVADTGKSYNILEGII